MLSEPARASQKASSTSLPRSALQHDFTREFASLLHCRKRDYLGIASTQLWLLGMQVLRHLDSESADPLIRPEQLPRTNQGPPISRTVLHAERSPHEHENCDREVHKMLIVDTTIHARRRLEQQGSRFNRVALTIAARDMAIVPCRSQLQHHERQDTT